MESIFSGDTLQRIAASDSLLAFDFDGTLAPIVDDPAQAAMRSSTRHLLAQTAQAYPCAVISGRPEEDVLRLLAGVTVWYVIGNRALQPPEEIERLSRQVSAWRAALVEPFASVPGISVEDKGVSLAIHYRHAAAHDLARAAIGSAASALPGVRVMDGKEVVNLLPANGPNKGSALDRIRAQLKCPTTLYVGDDRTDEDVFALDGGMVGVHVGAAAEPTGARYCLRDQSEIDELLGQLVELRPRRTLRPEAMWRPAPKRYA